MSNEANEPSAANNEMKLILIVDDEVDITVTYSMLLELHGYRTIAATDGRQALKLAAAHMPQLIISDCMMPVMDGIELSRQLRSDGRTAAIPIILMSAAPQRHLLAEACHDAFMQKPVRFKELVAVIGRLLPPR